MRARFVVLVLVACGAPTQTMPTRRDVEPVAGAIQGIVTDAKTRQPLAGATVIATSPALDLAQTAISDDTGAFAFADLPPGVYLVTFYYADITVEHAGLAVGAEKVTRVDQQLTVDELDTFVHVREAKPRSISPESTCPPHTQSCQSH